jgi:hypothetical protein
MLQNLRDAFRALFQTPIVSAVAILSLALGIGANISSLCAIDSAAAPCAGARPLGKRDQ